MVETVDNRIMLSSNQPLNSVVGNLDLRSLIQEWFGQFPNIQVFPKGKIPMDIHVFLRDGMGPDDHRQSEG